MWPSRGGQGLARGHAGTQTRLASGLLAKGPGPHGQSDLSKELEDQVPPLFLEAEASQSSFRKRRKAGKCGSPANRVRIAQAQGPWARPTKAPFRAPTMGLIGGPSARPLISLLDWELLQSRVSVKFTCFTCTGHTRERQGILDG